MNNASSDCRMRPGKTRVVEIVGPAGAGKTTLYQALNCYTETVRLGNFPDVRKLVDAPFFISNGLQLMPSLLRLYRRDSRQLSRREFAWMTILNGWPALIDAESNHGHKLIVLDQGPVYLLAEMQLFGPVYLRQRAAASLWQDLCSRWSTALRMVVWLDAPDDVLLDRIRTRQQDHLVKTQPADKGYEFLDRYRTEYERLLTVLTAKIEGLRVLRFDTGRQKPQDIVNRFLSEISC